MDIFQVELEGGDPAAAMDLAMEPYGTRLVYAEDDSDDSRTRLKCLAESWPRLWPEFRTRLQEASRHLDLASPVSADSLVCYVARLKPDVFMGDRCDTYLSLSSDAAEAPQWDCFLKDWQIIHFQPVF
jgi:hypothetical protein